MDLNVKIGKAIVYLRGAYGLSQERLALEAGIDRRYLSDLENGKRNPSLNSISLIASYFGLEISLFLSFAQNIDITVEQIGEMLSDSGYEDSVIFTAPDYAQAFVGFDCDGRPVYNRQIMAITLMADGMTYEEAQEFIDYNTLRALPYMGENHPIIIDTPDRP